MPLLQTFGNSSVRGFSPRGQGRAPLILFDYTNPNTNTGGWTGFFNAGTVNPILTANSDHLYVQAPWWCDGDARSNNNVDATGAKSVTIKVSSSVSTPTYYYSSFAYTNTSGGWSGISIGNPSNANFGVTTITTPISDAGNGKIKLNVVNSEGGGVRLYAVIFNF